MNVMLTRLSCFWVHRVKGLLAGLAGLVLMLSGCESSGPGYTETISRLETADSPRLYWLDNDHVFVPGYAPDDKLLNEEGKPKKGLYILDTRNNRYVRHADLGDGSRFCFHQGFITYSIYNKSGGDHSKDLQMEGMFGEEKLLPPGVRFNAEFNGNNSSYTDCPRVDQEKRLRAEHVEPMHRSLAVHAIYLREQDGYILADMCSLPYPECTIPVKETFDSPVRLYRPDRAEPIELPILAKEFAMGSYIRYVEWANKYLIVPAVRRDVPYRFQNAGLYGKAPYQAYLMSPDGRIETIPIPNGNWLLPQNAALTRAGLYFTGGQGTPQGDGGWLVKTDGEFRRLFDRPVRSAGVSPDGCKLAYETQYNTNKIKDGVIRILDFCSKN